MVWQQYVYLIDNSQPVSDYCPRRTNEWGLARYGDERVIDWLLPPVRRPSLVLLGGT